MVNKILVFFCLLFCTCLLHAQKKTVNYKLDDSRFFYEEDLLTNELDIFNRDSTLRYLDTSITTLHQYEMWYRDGNIAQDLGAIGSSVKPLYYSTPSILGLTSGYTHFDPYYFDNSEVKYYDTKRAYSSLNVIMGGNGRQYFKADLGRNIDERSSFGLVFRRLTSIDPIGANPGKDPFANHYSSQVFFNYHTKNQRYYLLANYRWMNHRLFETGGVKKDSLFQDEGYFSDIAQPNITGVTSNDRRNSWHLYQQFNFIDSSKTLQAYHIFDRSKQKYQYIDENVEENSDYYDNVFYDTVATNDSSTFEVLTNRVGLKGVVKQVHYSLFGLNRILYHSRNDTIRFSNYENYVGGSIGYVNKGLGIKSNVTSQYMLNGEYSLVKANFLVKGAFLNYSRATYSPTLLSQEYVGNHLFWTKTFESIESSSFEVGYKLKLKNIRFTPSFGLNEIRNYVYYDSTSNPDQTKEIINISYFGGKYDFQFNKIGVRGFVKHYAINSNLIRAPQLFWHNQIYLKGKLFKGVMDFESGIDTYFRDTYKGYGYSPITGQFILQDFEVFASTWIVDLYFNFKVNNLTLFLKMNHVNQLLSNTEGYLSTSGYPSQRRAIGFGARWVLFD